MFDPDNYDNQIFDGDGNSAPQGTSLDDWIDGAGGRDNVNGGPGADYVLAGPGNDWFVRGGSGPDIFQFGLGDNDVKIFDWEDGIDKVRLVDGLGFDMLSVKTVTYQATTTTILRTENGDRLMFNGITPDQIGPEDFIEGSDGGIGNIDLPPGFDPDKFENQFFGDIGSNPFQGTGQPDWIDGAGGRDNIHGGAGGDYIIAGPGNDWFVRGGSGSDIFQFGIGDNDVKIYDWMGGFDQVRLVGDLTFDDLTISSVEHAGITTTVLSAVTGDRLMFHDTSPSEIKSDDFIA